MNQIEKQKWLDAGGSELQHTFEGLGPDSIVFDIGLYRGGWSGEIVRRYNPYIYGFEPVKEFFDSAKSVLVKCPKVELFNYGLGKQACSVFIYLNKDSTSLIKESGRCQMVDIRTIEEFMVGHNIESVDLVCINIEGAEYDLLQHLLDMNLITKFKRLLIQFHDIGLCPEGRRKSIREDLVLTHKCIYSYDTVWDYWELLKGDSK